MNFEVIAQARVEQGSGASRRLRNAGRVPAIVYGGGAEPTVISLDHNAIFHQLRVEAFHASVLNLNIDGKVEKVLLRDVQHHSFKQLVLHVDFQRVNPNEKLHIKVPLHFVNADAAPGVKLGGGIINHVLNEVDVSCLPADLPEFIEVDLGNLQGGASIHLADIKLPNGVEIMALSRGDNQTVANCSGKLGGEEAAAE
ncbi:large subunit ribosomal protein L25 [Chitinivorax tropicus]|uniref:Large ribosomal subunit protein bL25 n=1 Tax=Chitinivorax tropicus TaxID=714531 RepID=A0A840MMS5_9PROT|nr:50S ribosomal protein L25/general stress protein Ctc [Chitinivorax tropicus]MBB5018419.1 large subunit ribosomal protein L25 [Chitinivorax tropicus]